jgi:uncharacterized protein YebE (UPF0316 family)
MKFLLVFLFLSIINVIFSTVRSITTIKSGKVIASLVSGGYFAFYNIMLIYTVADFPMWAKCLITFICNLIGVWLVKWVEEKMRKDKLWKVEVTVPNEQVESLLADCLYMNIEHYSYWDAYKYKVFNFYCATQKESAEVRELLKNYNVKYFVTESKAL